jgi:transcriptional regulator with XRE-family HTH domain
MRQFSDAFSEVVKEIRERKKLSRNAVAKRAGLHQTYIGLLERGQRSPNLDTAKAIAGALGVPLAKLITQAEKR